METPSVVHPVRFNIGGFIFEVVSYVPLTDEQALKVARMAYRRLKPKKKERGTIIRAVTFLDENSAGYL